MIKHDEITGQLLDGVNSGFYIKKNLKSNSA